jgi:2-methylcitrate dehydratase PrpD
MSITERIAEYSVNLSFDKIPKEAINKVKLLIADNIGCAIRGPTNLLGRKAVELTKELGGAPEATIFGTDLKSNCVQAAFVNSILANSMDYDDISPVGHPGSTIIPAALAIAERIGASGKELITAVTAGYEVCERVGLACRATQARYEQVHGLGTHQVFGAAVAVGRLLELNVDEMLSALGIAGAWAAMPHSGKFGNPLRKGRQVSFVKDNVSRPAEAGLLAALLAKKGWIGNKSIFDGEKGFWVMAGSDRFRPEFLLNLNDFKVMKVSFKPYPACRWVHTSLDALIELIRDHKFKPEEIKRVIVHSIRPIAEGFGNQNPANVVDAVFCVPYPLTMVLYQVPRSQWYLDENLKSSKYIEMAAKIEVEFDPEAQRKFESQETVADLIPTTLEVILKDGKKYSNYKEVPKGTPMNPISYEEIKDKFFDLTYEFLGVDISKELFKKLENLEKLERYSEIAEIIKPKR